MLKTDIESASKSSKSICDCSQILKYGKQAKKPTEQMVATNVAINELNQRKIRENNVMIYGAFESTKITIEEKSIEDKLKVTEIFAAIGKDHFEPVYLRRLGFKTFGLSGQILVELQDDSLKLNISCSQRIEIQN